MPCIGEWVGAPTLAGVAIAASRLRQLFLTIVCVLLTTDCVGDVYAEKPGSKKVTLTGVFEDHFDGNKLTNSWLISGWTINHVPNRHVCYLVPENVIVRDGYLAIRLIQEQGQVDDNPDGTISYGGLIYTKLKYGYGIYEFHVRMSSTAVDPLRDGAPAPGSHSGPFIYEENSITEIAFEFFGDKPDELNLLTWNNADRMDPITVDDRTKSIVEIPGLSTQFHIMTFIWEPGRVSFYVDDVLEAVHTTNIPTRPARIMLYHCGYSCCPTIGVERYFFVDKVRYLPLP